jgi:lipopolysaccharide/colanic/teichoic acid biosynthesis glycosyltransferase
MLIVGDALAILVAYILAYTLRVNYSETPAYYSNISGHDFFLSLLIFLPFVIILFSLIGTYTSRPQKKLARISRVFFGAGGAMLFMIMIHYFSIRPIFPSKLVPIYGFLFSIVLLSIERGILYFARFLRRRKKIGLIDTIIIGDNQISRDLAMKIRQDKNYKIQAVVGQNRFATHKTFTGAMRNFIPDLIIQVATRDKPEIDTEILNFAGKNFIDFKFVPREVSEIPDRLETEIFLGEIPMMSVQPTRLTGWGRVAKHSLDLVISTLFLIIFSWLYLIISIVNKIIFGKVFFKQIRLTRGDKKFKVYKFQTVRNDLNGLTPEKAFAKLGRPELAKIYRANGDFLKDDPRYGKWARFLRRTSLDELPQMWNVFRGDISLVGPRALIPDELNKFANKHQILNVKSGLTGLAVISGRKNLPWEQRRKLDIYYVQNWSFAMDLQILLKTFWQVLSGRGAK